MNPAMTTQGSQGSLHAPDPTLREMADDIAQAMNALGTTDTADQWLDVERVLPGALRSKWLLVRVMGPNMSTDDMEAYRAQSRWLGPVEWDGRGRCTRAEWVTPARTR